MWLLSNKKIECEIRHVVIYISLKLVACSLTTVEGFLCNICLDHIYPEYSVGYIAITEQLQRSQFFSLYLMNLV